jgi:hypothetical protein
VIVSGEGLGMLDELLVGHASLSDALFEQRAWRPVGQLAHLFGAASLAS